jgi:hypothetical protein
MKTRSIIYLLSMTLLAGSLAFTGCKKKKEFKNENGQASADNRTVNGETDAAIGDANDVISNETALSGKGTGAAQTTGVMGNICGLTVDKTNIASGVVILNYNGTVCNNRKREGSIKLTIKDYTLGKRWKNQGAVLVVDYMSYKITRASDGKSVELNGTHEVTNETGGTWWDLIFNGQASLAHTVRGTNLNVKFDDGKTAVYNINRKFTYTFTGNPTVIITCTGEGIGSSNGLNSLENFGTTRDGDSFTSQVTTPIIWNTTCGAHAPVQGAVNVKVDSKSFDLKVTFAVDASGNAVSVAPNTCAYGYKVEWTYKKKTKNKIFGYN